METQACTNTLPVRPGWDGFLPCRYCSDYRQSDMRRFIRRSRICTSGLVSEKLWTWWLGIPTPIRRRYTSVASLFSGWVTMTKSEHNTSDWWQCPHRMGIYRLVSDCVGGWRRFPCCGPSATRVQPRSWKLRRLLSTWQIVCIYTPLVRTAENMGRVIQLAPGFAYSHLYMGLARYHLNRVDLMYIHFEQFLCMSPESPMAWGIQQILHTLGRPQCQPRRNPNDPVLWPRPWPGID